MSGVVSTWYVYILRCADGTLYTGITTNLERRIAEHNGKGLKGKGAKYTAARRPIRFVYSEEAAGRSEASTREHQIRTLTRAEKLKLISLYRQKRHLQV